MQLVEIGQLLKAHGIKGELHVQFEFPFIDEDHLPSAFFIGSADSLAIPYFVKSLVLGETYDVISFHETPDRTSAEKLVRKKLWMDQSSIEDYFQTEPITESEYENYIGFTIIDLQSGKTGFLKDVMLMPGHEVGIIEIQSKEYLIPLHDDLIAEADESRKELRLHIPAGLLNLPA